MRRLAGTDLPDYFPSDLELRLQDQPTFELLHKLGEAHNFLFALGHSTIRLAAQPSIDIPPLTNALLLGVEVYEVITAAVDTNTYDSEDERQVVTSCVFDFVSDIKKPDDFMTKAEYAEARLMADAPVMAGVVHEVVARYVEHDKVATRFALRGAGVMRAMHIFVDRKLAA